MIRTAAILGRMADDQQGPSATSTSTSRRRSWPAYYANFANVSHSDYEFTLTFARVDHEVEDDEIPGVVVSRINLSPRFMRELIDAMEDNYSKWRTREGIKNLPEYDGRQDRRAEARTIGRAGSGEPLLRPRKPTAAPIRSAVGGCVAEQRGHPARRVEVGDVLERDRALERR